MSKLSLAVTELKPMPEGQYEVIIKEEAGNRAEESRHIIDVPARYVAEYSIDANDAEAVEELVRNSFTFLLERENKEMILPKFALRDIERFFPEFHRLMNCK